MKYPKPFKDSGSRYYSFWYQDSAGKRHIKSTRCERASDAHDFVREYVDTANSKSGNVPFVEYQARFYTERCPHSARLRDEGRHVGLTHVTKCRQALDRWIVPKDLPSPLGEGANLAATKRIRAFVLKPMNRITRGDLLDLRNDVRIRVKVESKRKTGDGMATVNNVISTVSTIFSEAYLRENILRNPAMKFRPMAYDRQERGVLTIEEHWKLFGTIWTRKNHKGEYVPDELSHDVFEFAALTGMRCSEVLRMVPSEQLRGRILVIDRAFKGKEDGRPKHEKIREIMLCQRALEIAHRYPKGFRLEDGSRLGATWWRKRFTEGLDQKEIKAGDRMIVPHSLRHSLATHLARNGVNLLLIQLSL